MPLDVLIVGGGLAGLATAIGIRNQGHRVRVFERRSTSGLDEGGSGIQLQPNVNHVLEAFGMLDDVAQIAHDNVKTALKDGQTGETIGVVPFYGPAYFTTRGAYKDLFRETARRRGVEILEGVGIAAIDPTTPSISLANGTIIVGDLVIGADGSGSKVRRTLFPQYSPTVTNMVCHQIVLPLDAVEKDPVLRRLLSGPHNSMTMAPHRNIFLSPSLPRGIYDLQFVDHKSHLSQDPDPETLNKRIHDLSILKQRWSDHDTSLRRALDLAASAYKWRFVEVAGLSSWTSQDGKVILIGDACHAMVPFAGQGAAMGIEDGGALAALLRPGVQKDDLSVVAKAYEEIRRPRAEKIQQYARRCGKTWTLENGEQVRRRNDGIRAMQNASTPRSSQQIMDAPYASEGFVSWLNFHDVFQEVEKYRRARARI